jgi:hypothetical protein
MKDHLLFAAFIESCAICFAIYRAKDFIHEDFELSDKSWLISSSQQMIELDKFEFVEPIFLNRVVFFSQFLTGYH